MLLDQGYVEVVEVVEPQQLLPPAPAAVPMPTALATVPAALVEQPGPSRSRSPPKEGMTLSERTYQRNQKIYEVGVTALPCTALHGVSWRFKSNAGVGWKLGGVFPMPAGQVALFSGRPARLMPLHNWYIPAATAWANGLEPLPATSLPGWLQEERAHQNRLAQARMKCRQLASEHRQRGEYALADQFYQQAARYQEQEEQERKQAARRIGKRM